MPGDFAGGDVAEIIALAAGKDRGREFFRLGGGEDEFHMLRRLFQRFQQGVERLLREHVDFVDDEDFEPPADGAIRGIRNDIADIVDAGVARGIDLDHVDILAAGDPLAGIAFPAGRIRGAGEALAIERLGQDAGHGSLADAARAAEEVRMGDPSGADGFLECLRNVVLPDHLIEVRRAIATGKDGVSHGEGDCRRAPGRKGTVRYHA